MARIPDAEIERLKDQVSVQHLVEGAGVALKRTGKDWVARCPFHEDATASLVITPAKNLWHCFGCQTGGGPIDWVMKAQGVSFRHAVEILKQSSAAQGSCTVATAESASSAESTLAAGVAGVASPARLGVKRSLVRQLPTPVALQASEQELLNQTISYYHETLLQNPQAQAYLAGRGLGGEVGRELISRFRLGFANRTLGLRLPQARVKAGGELRTRLQALGILRASGHEHFNGCLIVPIMDAALNVVEVYGRKVVEASDGPKHLYLPGPHHGVWNWQGLQGAQEVILCEALLDAMTFWCAGWRNVTAAYGVEGFNDEHVSLFTQLGVRRVLIAFDRDAAGEQGAAKVAQRLMALGMECLRIQFPKGMDANDYAQKVQPAAKSLGLLVRQAVWLGKGGVQVDAGVVVQAAAPQVAKPAMPDTINSIAACAISTSGNPLNSSHNSIPTLPEVPPVAMPPAPADPSAAAVLSQTCEDESLSEDELSVHMGPRRWRVRGLAKGLSPQSLRLNILVTCGELFYADALDLYAARARVGYTVQAARELAVREEVIKHDLGRLLLRLEALQHERLHAALACEVAAPVMSPAEHDAALAWLQTPGLLARILADFAAWGLVGEDANKLMAYLVAVSRKLSHPLAMVVQSSSAAGKSSLMDAVLAFMPEEERIKYSAMTGQSLFYMGQSSLKHKILAIAEEEGASRAGYALKLLQSDGELTMASTGKDARSGNLVTQEYRVEGPVAIMLTTTAIEVDEELLNRCIVLSVDESRSQTEAIHRLQRQRRTLDGLRQRQERSHIVRIHQNAQRLLRPLAVVNPYANRLTFLSDQTRTRRDHEKYLTLIDTIALLHQYQRPVKTLPLRDAMQQGASQGPTQYIEVQLSDIEQANQLAHELLGASLDELPPVTRSLLGVLVRMVAMQMQGSFTSRDAIRFSRKDARQASGMSDTQLRVHLQRLVELEYVLTHRGMRGQSFEYELLYDGQGTPSGISGDAQEAAADASGQAGNQASSPRAHLSGLIDVVALRAAHGNASAKETPQPTQSTPTDAATNPSSRGSASQFAAPARVHHGADAGATRQAVHTPMPSHLAADLASDLSTPTATHLALEIA